MPVYNLSGVRVQEAEDQSMPYKVGDMVVETRDLELGHATYLGVVIEIGDDPRMIKRIEWKKWSTESFHGWDMISRLTRLVHARNGGRKYE